MILTVLFLSSSALMGLGIVHRTLPQLLHRLEKVLWGVVFGWSLSTLAVYLLARWQSKLSLTAIIAVTILSFVTATALLAPAFRYFNKTHFLWRRQFTAPAFLLILFTPIYWQAFSSHFFAPRHDGVYSGGSAYADMSFHAALSTSFIYGDNFPPAYTPSAGKPLLYPFLPDFQTAALMSTGISMRRALLITSVILAVATTLLLYCFAFRITANVHVGYVAPILFLLNGGLGFIDLIRDWRSSDKSCGEFWSSLTVNYANYSDHALHWPNIITDGFVPQRTLLFGLPLGIMVLTLFAAEWTRAEAEEKAWHGPTNYLFAGLITGVLSWFHTHTFIAIGLISGALFLLKPHRRWLLFWLASLLIASPGLLNLVRHGSAGGFLRLQLGWMGHDAAFFPWYLLRNLGLPLVLAIPAWFILERHWRRFYLAFVFVLVFAFAVVVSPNLFDNGKLIYYWHAANSVIVANLLVHLWLKYQQRLIAVILMLVCIATGVTALQSERLQFSLLFNHEQIGAASFAGKQTAPQSLFLTAPVTNQPILCLAGRKILRGPTAWLWSHGFEFRDREADVRRIYAGTSDAKELLNYYDVDYIYLSDVEREQLHAQPTFFDTNFPVVFKSQTITIYDARGVNQTQASPQRLSKTLEYDPFALFVDFSGTSFFAYRTLLSTNAHLPTLAEFSEAMQRLTQDVSLESPTQKEQLESNRQQFINERAKQFSGFSNADYVSNLIGASAADTKLSTQLLTGLEHGTETRATVLRKIVDERSFYQREYNTAYVLMHYFGYLQRNPSDPPDNGLSGLNYWRDILDKSGDYRSISRAFMESEEYKKREIR